MLVDPHMTRKVIDLGALCLRLSRVNRITFHPDGRRPETDSDHTVMLGIIACAFAERYLPQLDLGKIAQYAYLHDLPEAYAGDTPTLRITSKERREKKLREKVALDRIGYEFGQTLPWVPITLYDYESQADPEARYVKALDKLLPKITHILNNGATFGTTAGHMTREELVRRYDEQIDELEEYARDDTGSLFFPLFELRAYLVGMVLDMTSLEVEAQ